MAQYRTLELVCPYDSGPETPAPDLLPTPLTPPTTTDSADPRPQIICSSHQMSVKIPSGPISGILLKGLSVCVSVCSLYAPGTHKCCHLCMQ